MLGLDSGAPGAPSDLSKSTEIWLPKIGILSATYEFRTKSAKSRGLEKDGRRERILALGGEYRSAEVCARRPVFIGDCLALASSQRTFGAVRLAERDEPGSNILQAVDNSLLREAHRSPLGIDARVRQTDSVDSGCPIPSCDPKGGPAGRGELPPLPRRSETQRRPLVILAPI